MLLLYGIPNCDTVKKARAFLDARGIAYRFHDYKKQGIDRPRLERWLEQRPWEELLNRTGTTYRQVPGAERPGTRDAAIALMLARPSVIRRPLVEDEAGRIVAVGFRAEEYEKRIEASL
jgi:arsenate reductase